MPVQELLVVRRAEAKCPADGYIALSSEQKWWNTVRWLAQIQLGCSLLMQLSYVAFPSYNFALALWCLLACTSTWSAKFTRLVPLHMISVSFSVVTDIIWMSLWVSGRVFYNQFCSAKDVSIVSCGGASDRFPGCSVNQFALFMLIINLLAKVAFVASMQRIHASKSAKQAKHRNYIATDEISDTLRNAQSKSLFDDSEIIAASKEISISSSDKNEAVLNQ